MTQCSARRVWESSTVSTRSLKPRIEAPPAAQPGATRTQRRATHFARLLPVQDTKQPRHLEEQNAITGDGSGAWRCRTLLRRRHGHPPRPRERTKSCERGCGRRGCKTRKRASQAQDANAPDPSIGFLAQLRDCCDLAPPFRRSTRRCRGTKRGTGKSTRHTWILLWAEKSAGPQSGKIFRRIPKKNAGDLKKHPDPRF